MRSSRVAASGLAALAALLIAAPADAQLARYVGRAIASVSTAGATSQDAMAGGDTPDITCDISLVECFDVQVGGAAGPRTSGGAPTDATRPPGFPQVVSTSGGVTVDVIPGTLQVITGTSTATADSFTGELSCNTQSALVRLLGQDLLVLPGEELDVLGLVKLTIGRESFEEHDGLSVATCDGTVLQIPSTGPETVLGRSIAGLEIAFTTGGGIGGGGCAIGGPRSGRGTLDFALAAELTLLIGGLGWIARRRRPARR